MNKDRLEEAKKLANHNYTIEISQDNLSDGSVIFMARNPELKGCKAQGVTRTEAVNNLRDARIDYIYFLLEDGLDVPSPKSQENIITQSIVIAGTVNFKPAVNSDDTNISSNKYEITYS
ncbi:MAG: type II toxin-antitoxin system HicB family antitoxin [bacterium]|nr:type II toxin-antitoxin system HicB family antitoxin [bacterium]